MMMGYFPMLIIMFIAGILSSMSIWADKLSDMAISLNDIYMSLLMCGWMLFFMGLYDFSWDGIYLFFNQINKFI